MSSVPPHLAEAIQRLVDEMETDGEARWLQRVCRERLNALPVAGNQIYLWALRPDGAVLCLDHEAFSLPVEEETDPVALYAVFHRAALRYPELRELEPARPAGAEPCGACDGTGIEREGGGSCLACWGLGWHAAPRPAREAGES